MSIGSTSSRGTRVLGISALVGLVWLALLGLVFSPAEVTQGDLVRLMYVHVPSAWTAYVAFGLTAAGSLGWLWKKSQWWDLVAVSAAEIGVVFCGLALVTGSIWGRPTWGSYWEWGDARLVTTLVLFLTALGYLAVRQVPAPPTVRAQRSAIVGLVMAINIPIVHFSVRWWRTLHQEASVVRIDTELDGLMLFTLMLGTVVFMVLFAWMMLHRFRIAWLEDQIDEDRLGIAIAERRAEAHVGAS